MEQSQNNSSVVDKSTARKTNTPPYTGDGGKGVVIAVPPPVLHNATPNDKWMPQFFQDIITGGMARFSAMTVIDRSNEQLVLAEQNLSASGNYSDDDYIRMGRLSNARFIVVGSIQNVSGRYNVSFRINNTETNEIKASFNKAYPVEDVESGLAAKEAVRELIAGMGIELTAEGEARLLAVQDVKVRSTIQLAKGMTAQKDNNIVDALAYYTQAVQTDPGMREAETHIQNFARTQPGTSIQERANYALEQKAKWEKIFSDLSAYIKKNLVIAVYDFSMIEDSFSAGSQAVTIKITPGIKFIPNRTVLVVWKTVMDEWERIKRLDENKSWVNNILSVGNVVGSYEVKVGLYDDYGDLLKEVSVDQSVQYYKTSEITAQHKYFDNRKFSEIVFSRIPLANITDNIIPKITSGIIRSGKETDGPILSISEWQEWLALQGGAGK